MSKRRQNTARAAGRVRADGKRRSQPDRGSGARDGRRIAAIALALVVLTLILRFLHLGIIDTNPYYTAPILDERDHHAWASDIVAGRGTEYLPYYRAPGYAYALALAYAPGADIPRGRHLSAVLGALTVALTFLAASRLASTRVALTAAIALALYPTAFYFDGMLLGASLDAFLSTGALLLLLLARERPTTAMLLTVGAVLGIATITRPLMGILLPVALVALARPRAGDGPRIVATVLAAWAVPVLWVSAANLVIGNDQVVVASNGGINFYLGNHDGANGWSAAAPDIRASLWLGAADAERIASRELGRQARPSEVSSYWMGRGLDFVTGDPGAWLALMTKKLLLLVGASEIQNNQNIDGFRRYSPFLRIPLLGFALVIAMAAPQFVRRASWRQPLCWWVAVYALGIVFFFVTARFRFPIVPALLILAAITVWDIVDGVRRAQWRALAPVAVLAVAVAVVSHAAPAGRYDPNAAEEHYGLGNRHLDAGRLEAAITEFQKAIDIPNAPPTPVQIQARNAIGTALLRQERSAEARAVLAASLALAPTSEAYARLGWAYTQEGKRDSARAALARSLDMRPGPEALYFLGHLERESGNAAAAIDAWERGLALGPDPAQRDLFYYVLARLYIDSGRELDRALDYLERITRPFPDIEALKRAARGG